ncbi:hypothetical protein [Caldivirga sp. UBA161]|uniref:hypothetical protein n=1 Tax=Caldivirga sp. UBA161 TaxID=1915569 RepID=UPI0025BEFDC7|nr:hypothetical protein [Caldivirga sp. UBA161]
MGKRRKTRKLLVRPKKRLPTVFQCPYCGSVAVNVSVVKKENKVKVTCGVCGLEAVFDRVNGLLPVDYYNKFVDKYFAGELKPTRQVEVKVNTTNTNQQNQGIIDSDEGIEYLDAPEPDTDIEE